MDNLEIDLSTFDVRRIQLKGKKLSDIYIFSKDDTNYFGKVVKIPFDDSQKEEFEKSIRYLKEINYPTILHVIGWSINENFADSFPMIITEFMPRKSLDIVFMAISNKKQSQSWTDTKRYITAIGVAYGMRYLHSKDIIHKNLRPSKIFFDNNYYPHVSYLTLDPEFENEGELPKQYIDFYAPELFNSWLYQECTKATDVYAYSIIIYQLFTNKNPPGKSQKRQQADLATIDQNMKKFFETCWNENPEKRPSFNDIVEYFSQDSIKSAFGNVDYDEIDKYINSFLIPSLADSP